MVDCVLCSGGITGATVVATPDGKVIVVMTCVESGEWAVVSKDVGAMFGSGMASAGDDFGSYVHAGGKYCDRVETGTNLTCADSLVIVS